MNGPRLLLMRHGQTVANRRGRWHGATDGPLTWRGRRQARTTRRHLAQSEPGITAVYASPLQRCQITAQLASGHTGLPINTVPELAEMNIGEWEDLSFDVLERDYGLVGRLTSDPAFAPAGGESLDTVARRMTGALAVIDSSHAATDTVLVVSHGVALAAGLAQLIDGAAQHWVNYHFHNCSLTELCLRPEPVVYSFNQYGHL